MVNFLWTKPRTLYRVLTVPFCDDDFICRHLNACVHTQRLPELFATTLLLMLPLDGAECAGALLAPRVLLQDVVVVVDGRRRGRDAVRLDDVHAAAVVVVLDAIRVGADLDHRLHGDGIAVEILHPRPRFHEAKRLDQQFVKEATFEVQIR